MLAKQRARKRTTLTTATLASRQRQKIIKKQPVRESRSDFMARTKRTNIIKDIEFTVKHHYTQYTHKPLPAAVKAILKTAQTSFPNAISQARRLKYPIGSYEYNTVKELIQNLEVQKSRVPAVPQTAVVKQKKADLRHQQKRAIKGAQQILAGQMIDSSWITSLEWFPDERVWVTLNGRKYTWKNVPEAIFNSWYRGAATCMTNDISGGRRWLKGDSPSLGAYFNHYIKNKYHSWTTGWVSA